MHMSRLRARGIAHHMEWMAERSAHKATESIRNELEQIREASQNVPHLETREMIHRLLAAHDGLEEAIHVMEAAVETGGKWQRKKWQPVVRTLCATQGKIVACMETMGITPMEMPDQVDFQRHEPIKVRSTSRQELNGYVTEVIRKGFLRDGSVLRPHQVEVLKWNPTEPEG